jgi:hypothetical protein
MGYIFNADYFPQLINQQFTKLPHYISSLSFLYKERYIYGITSMGLYDGVPVSLTNVENQLKNFHYNYHATTTIMPLGAIPLLYFSFITRNVYIYVIRTSLRDGIDISVIWCRALQFCVVRDISKMRNLCERTLLRSKVLKDVWVTQNTDHIWLLVWRW